MFMPGQLEFARASLDGSNDLVSDVLVDVEAIGSDRLTLFRAAGCGLVGRA